MKKNDITKEISNRLEIPKVECELVIDTFADIIKEALANGDKIIIRDFLTFEISEYKARKGYNPYTGETEEYAPTRTVKCKVGKAIKEAVRGTTNESIEFSEY